jgi:hypothetical protein
MLPVHTRSQMTQQIPKVFLGDRRWLTRSGYWMARNLSRLMQQMVKTLPYMLMK